MIYQAGGNVGIGNTHPAGTNPSPGAESSGSRLPSRAGIASSKLTIYTYCNTIIDILSRPFLALSENSFKRPRNLSKVA